MARPVERLRDVVVARAVRGRGRASIAARQAAFENTGVDERVRPLLDKVAQHAWKVTDADVAAAKANGLSEDEIFELVVCAAVGQASRQLQSALDAVDAAGATHKEQDQ